MALQSGETVGIYQIQEQLGTGGMATVYKAQHTKLDRHVAIKMMHPQFQTDPNFIARFEREAKVVARLEHPNIVPVYDYSEHNGQPYLVMKYIDGRTLKGMLRKGALSLDEILTIMGTVAAALDYAHKQGVLHRDVKPSNIIIGVDDTPYITDFGLARIAETGESTMSADMMLGTPQYISPEQARGDKQIDHRTDLYSFAVILYELIVGRVPFSAETAVATVHAQIYTPPPPPSQLNPQITPAVEMVLLKALSKEPSERYPSAKVLMQALSEAFDTSGVRELDPKRASLAVPVQFTPSPIPPAVKETGTQPPAVVTRDHEPSTAEEVIENIASFGGKAAEAALKAVGKAIVGDHEGARESGREARQIGEKIRAEIEAASRDGDRRKNKNANTSANITLNRNRNRRGNRQGVNFSRLIPREDSDWVQDGPEGAGFYTKDELDALLPEDERLRRHVEKKMEERTAFIIHFTIYLIVNAMIVFGGLSDGDFSPWLFAPAFFWGIGVFAHFMGYYNEFGGGRNRREAAIQREIEIERSRLTTRKSKNDELFYEEDAAYDDIGSQRDDAARRIRLTEDGELTESYIEEIDPRKRKRN